MNYKVLTVKDDSKKATRYDVLVETGAPKKRGFWEKFWEGESDPNPPEPIKKYAMRISSALPKIVLEVLLALIFERRDKWRYNQEKNLYSVQLPTYEGFAIIKEATDDDKPASAYFPSGGRKKKIKPVDTPAPIEPTAELETENKPDPHLL